MGYSPSSYLALISLLFLFGCAASKTSPEQARNAESAPMQDPAFAGAPSADHAAPGALSRTDDDEEDDDSPDDGTEARAARGEPEQGEESLLDGALELVETSQEYWAAGDREKAIETLDQAYALILTVPTDGNTKLIQQKEDLRFMISKRILEIYTSRVTAVNGKHKEIPVTVNEHVEREIRVFQTVERDFFLESYQRSGRYRENMAAMIREAGLPEELSWLPLIESGFKVRALSRARALGLWQFIPSTGYKFGLKRNAWVDERLDPDKSTAAAIAYLRELHGIFGDWATVLAAYNCGEGSVLRVIREQKINYLDNFWDLYERLPRETARYYPRFLASLAILKDPARYGFELGEPYRPTPFDVVTIEKPVNLRKLAEKIGSSSEELVALNPELRHEATPNASYDLRVPKGMKDTVLAAQDSLPAWSPPRPSYVYHRVRRGETLSLIALRYRTSVQRIIEANRLRDERMIRAGQKLRIPLRDVT